MEQLRAELAAMKLGELRKRARAAGVEAAAIEAAADESDDPKVAVAELIVSAESSSMTLASLEAELAAKFGAQTATTSKLTSALTSSWLEPR